MRKLNVTILVGLIVAALGFAMVFFYGRNVDDKVADGKQTQSVLVAKSMIPPGTTADGIGAFIETEDIPTAYLADNAITDLSQIAGKSALGPIDGGVQLTAGSFGDASQVAAGGGAVVPSKGKVAVAVQTAITPGVARYIAPGSIVDLFVTYGGGDSGASTPGATTAAPGTVVRDDRTKLFVSGVKVLSVQTAPLTIAGTEGETSTQAAVVPEDAVIAVLDLTPVDAERVVNAVTNGKIYVGLSSVDGTVAVHRTPTGAGAVDVLKSNR